MPDKSQRRPSSQWQSLKSCDHLLGKQRAQHKDSEIGSQQPAIQEDNKIRLGFGQYKGDL